MKIENDHCQLCGATGLKEIVDGRTITGQWAWMCNICHKLLGVGLGTGKGQRYVDGVKVDG